MHSSKSDQQRILYDDDETFSMQEATCHMFSASSGLQAPPCHLSNSLPANKEDSQLACLPIKEVTSILSYQASLGNSKELRQVREWLGNGLGMCALVLKSPQKT